MSGLPSEVVMPADHAQLNAAGNAVYVVPGRNITYVCAPGSSVTVPMEHGEMMRSNGWVGITNARWDGAGATTSRPNNPTVGRAWNDTTVGAPVVYAGPVSGWLHSTTGASE